MPWLKFQRPYFIELIDVLWDVANSNIEKGKVLEEDIKSNVEDDNPNNTV